ncbi:MAG: serine/threonine protein kinase [Myxococcales bacterium]|nr:serine/threonine protein kinase [Myxococcales bacterium]
MTEQGPERPTKPSDNGIDCTVCGSWMPEGTNFCGVCGARLYTGRRAIRAQPEVKIIGRIIANRYKVLKMLGQGGMGAVYLVEHVYIGKLMAMKVLHARLMMYDEVVRRFKREAESVSKLSSIHTVTVFDFGKFDEMFFIVMEYLKGKDLGYVLDELGPMPAARAVRIVLQICDSLAEAHEVGIIHRDLKPENIFIITLKDGRDFVKVLDFGLAKLVEGHEIEETGTLSGAGRLVGTPYYMSPEQIRNQSVDHRSDIYGLGAVIYRMLSGDVVFDGDSAMEVVSKHLTSPPIPLSRRDTPHNLPVELDRVVSRCLKKNPAERYKNVEELANDLNELIAREGGSPLTLSHLPLGVKAVPRRMADGDAPTIAEPKSSSASEREPEPKTGGRAIGHLATEPAMIAVPRASTRAEKSDPTPIAVDAPGEPRATSNHGAEQSHYDWTFQFDGSSPGSTWHEALDSVEMERITTRREFDTYEKTLRRKRVWTAILPIALLGIGGFLFVWGYLFGHLLPSGWEREPNDHVRDATPLVLGRPIRGHLGRRQGKRQGDLDFFHFRNPFKEGFLEIDLEPVPNMNVAVEINCTSEDRFVPMDFNARGEAERVRFFLVSRPDCYILVRETPPPDGLPTENTSDAYRLTARVVPYQTGFEEEPNSSVTLANSLAIGKTLSGELSGRRDIDVFRVDHLLTTSDGVLATVTTVGWIEPRMHFIDKKGVVLSSGGVEMRPHQYELTGFLTAPGEPLFLVLSGSADTRAPRPYRVRLAKTDIREKEPNDDAKSATRATLGGRLRGRISKAGDVDWFRFEAPLKGFSAVRVELKGGGTLDLQAELRDEKGLVLSTLNHSGPGDGEFAPSIDLKRLRGPLFVRVSSEKSGEHSSDEYTLLVTTPHETGKVKLFH